MMSIDSTEPEASRSLPGDSWFRGAGLGVFIHWDHSSQQGIEISWPLVGQSIWPGRDVEDQVDVAGYQATAATFDPQKWDAARLAALIRRSGATYAVFTARHHAGYSMFFSQQSDFSVENSPVGRDLTREFVEAVRAEGLRVGIYYSLPDWHHPDYPAFADADRPYPREHWPSAGLPQNVGLPVATHRHRRSGPEAWQRYLDYLRGQLRELLTGYGPIDLLWFDGEWERSAEEWDSAGLRRLIDSLQPEIVVNDRLPGQGDYSTPEQGFPVEPHDGPWELCLTIGDVWAWHPRDTEVKSARTLVRTLVEVVSRGGNLLLNLGPDGQGEIAEGHQARVEEIGRWMQTHRDSVVGVTPAPEIDFYGPVTRNDDVIFLHLVMRPVDELIVRQIPVTRVRRVRLLAGGDLEFATSQEVHLPTALSADLLGELRIPAPAPTGALVDVVAIELNPLLDSGDGNVAGERGRR
jgi:alpha-L-fucosidase